MSYTPITWTDKSTLMAADHMNQMEQALKDHDDKITELSTSLADLVDGKGSTNNYGDDADSIIDTGVYRATSTISNVPSAGMSGGGFLIVFNGLQGSSLSAKIILQLCFSSTGAYFYFRTCWYGTWSSWRTMSLTTA